MNNLLLIPQYTDDSTIQEDLYTGAFFLTLNYQQLQEQDTEALTEKDRLYQWWKISGKTFKGSLPIKFEYTDNAIIDAYTLESDKVCKFGDLILGADSLELPKFSACKTVLGDVLGAMLMNMLNDEPELAYSLLQTSFYLMSVYSKNNLFSSQTDLTNLKSGVMNER